MAGSGYVYDFSQGSKDMKALLGGKGAGLAEMTTIGLPVPDGFIITTQACRDYLGAGDTWPDGLRDQIAAHLADLERRLGKRLGDPSDPLLVSVRSGSPVSMPGMMDTILNLGLNDRSVQGLAARSGDERFALDSYRRFVQMFGEVVMGVDGHLFEDALDRLKLDRGVRSDVDLDAADLRRLLDTFRGIYRSGTGADFPQEPGEQLERSVEAVFRSWNTPRAITYRRHDNIPDDLGTAVNVGQMVFGNLGPTSATGVAFTRNPSTGERELYGEFLVNAQGEDVVAGIRTPRPLSELAEVSPQAFDQLRDAMQLLESHYKEMQDVEFTIEQGTLYILQTRTGKRTAQAAVRVARDLVEEKVLDRRSAIGRIDPTQLDQLLHPGIDPGATYDVLATGLNASPGAAVGRAVFDADTAESRGRTGEPVILVRWETTPDDIHGLIQAQGVVTAHGGMTSHAAVVARGMGKPCVCGVEALHIDAAARNFTVNGTTISEGDEISVDGSRGLVIRGAVRLVPPQINEDFRTITGWADDVRRLGVRGQRRHSRGRDPGARVRRRGDRSLPHRAHVLRRRPPAGDARDDPGLRRVRPPGRARPAAAVPAVRLRRHPEGDGGLPGHNPPARPAAARVPPAA